MALGTFCLSIALVFTCGICCCAGDSQEPCQGNIGNREVYAPFGGWAPLNCTHNCPQAEWESRLTKRNIIKGPGWISVEVEVGTGDIGDGWKASHISCTVLSGDDAVDNIVTVIPYEIPRLVTVDMEDQLEEGKSYDVTCTVHGVAPIQNLMVTVFRGTEMIQQKTFKDDSRDGNITEAVTFAITAQRSDNMKDFSCQATLALGTDPGNVIIESPSVSVRTFALPEKPKLESGQWIEVGTKHNATCTVSNAFPLEHLNLTMLFNKIALNVTTTRMADGSLLGFAEISPDTNSSLETHQLDCKAQVLSLSTEAFMDIYVYEPPNIIFTVSPDSVRLNETVAVSCKLNNNNPEQYDIMIRMNEKQICEGRTSYCNVSVNGRTPQSIVSCIASLYIDLAINKVITKNIKVHYSPLFHDNQCPDQLALREGRNDPFECRADGNPPPIVTCSRNSGILPTDKPFIIDRAQAGHYRCLATNDYGTVNKTIEVEVQYPPVTPNIAAVPAASISEGGALNITCSSDGLPQPEYRWVIPVGVHVVYLNNNSVIFIPEASSSHSGTYTCLAINQHGKTSVELMIDVTNNWLVIILCVVGCALALAVIIGILCYRRWINGKRGFYNLWKTKPEKPQEEEMAPIKPPCNNH